MSQDMIMIGYSEECFKSPDGMEVIGPALTCCRDEAKHFTVDKSQESRVPQVYRVPAPPKYAQ